MVRPWRLIVLACPTVPRTSGELLDLVTVGVIHVWPLNSRLEYSALPIVYAMDAPRMAARLPDRLLRTVGNSTAAWRPGCYRLGIR